MKSGGGGKDLHFWPKACCLDSSTWQLTPRRSKTKSTQREDKVERRGLGGVHRLRQMQIQCIVQWKKRALSTYIHLQLGTISYWSPVDFCLKKGFFYFILSCFPRALKVINESFRNAIFFKIWFPIVHERIMTSNRTCRSGSSRWATQQLVGFDGKRWASIDGVIVTLLCCSSKVNETFGNSIQIFTYV